MLTDIFAFISALTLTRWILRTGDQIHASVIPGKRDVRTRRFHIIGSWCTGHGNSSKMTTIRRGDGLTISRISEAWTAADSCSRRVISSASSAHQRAYGMRQIQIAYAATVVSSRSGFAERGTAFEIQNTKFRCSGPFIEASARHQLCSSTDFPEPSGPHALVAGTTGFGKSVLLQAGVALASMNEPEHLISGFQTDDYHRSHQTYHDLDHQLLSPTLRALEAGRLHAADRLCPCFRYPHVSATALWSCDEFHIHEGPARISSGALRSAIL